MLNFSHPDIVGKEPKKKIKFRVVKNSWIDVEDYKIHPKHQILVDNGRTFHLWKVSYYGKDLKRQFELFGVKRIMILSRK